jgi:hypothetical protein
MDISKWYKAETTTKQVFEGIYPVVIVGVRTFTKEAEKDGKPYNREVLEMTFKTTQDVPFPDNTTGKIVVKQNYYFDVDMHVNAFNGVARAFLGKQFKTTEEFDGKIGMIGITNNTYEKDGETKYVAQMGAGLFSYAPLPANPNIEYIANDIQNPTDEEKMDWFKTHIKNLKPAK